MELWHGGVGRNCRGRWIMRRRAPQRQRCPVAGPSSPQGLCCSKKILWRGRYSSSVMLAGATPDWRMGQSCGPQARRRRARLASSMVGWRGACPAFLHQFARAHATKRRNGCAAETSCDSHTVEISDH